MCQYTFPLFMKCMKFGLSTSSTAEKSYLEQDLCCWQVSVYYQLIACFPFAKRYSFVLLKCLFPKKPL